MEEILDFTLIEDIEAPPSTFWLVGPGYPPTQVKERLTIENVRDYWDNSWIDL